MKIINKTDLERFEDRYIVCPSGCWIWLLSCDKDGYGHLKIHGVWKSAHVWSYELNVGPVPDGLELDHKCRVRNCVNWRHLEPVTYIENILRSNSPIKTYLTRTNCKYGHDLTLLNSFYISGKTKNCKQCKKLREFNYRIYGVSMIGLKEV